MTMTPSMLQPGVMRRPTAKPARRGPGRPPLGRIKAMFSIEPEQLAALRREAFRRAASEPRGRPDVSAVVREVLAGWMRESPKKG